MSWDSFIQNGILEKQLSEGKLTNCCESAGIISKLSGEIWACSANFALLSYPLEISNENSDKKSIILMNESKEILNLFKSGCRPPKVQIRINKQMFEFIRHNEETSSIYFKRPQGGACIASSNLTLIISTYDETQKVYLQNQEEYFQNAGLCNERVENLSDFLRNAGF
jgi:hypothetical protein